MNNEKTVCDGQSFYFIIVRMCFTDKDGKGWHKDKFGYYIQLFSDGNITAFTGERSAFEFLHCPIVNPPKCVIEFYNHLKPSICHASNIEFVQGLMDGENESSVMTLVNSGGGKTSYALCKPEAEAHWLDGRIYNLGSKYE